VRELLSVAAPAHRTSSQPFAVRAVLPEFFDCETRAALSNAHLPSDSQCTQTTHSSHAVYSSPIPARAQVNFVDGRIRGRIRLPNVDLVGWITLAQPSHGWQWAELAPAEAEKQPPPLTRSGYAELYHLVSELVKLDMLNSDQVRVGSHARAHTHRTV
jgi:hypothetical protein